MSGALLEEYSKKAAAKQGPVPTMVTYYRILKKQEMNARAGH